MYERLIADLIVKGILLCSDSTAGGGEKSVHQRGIHHPLVIVGKIPRLSLTFSLHVTFYTVSSERISEYNTDHG